MKFEIKINEKTALYTAIKKENIEIVKLLLASDIININFLNISSRLIYTI